MDIVREEGRHSCIIYIFDLFTFIMHMPNSSVTEVEAFKMDMESEEGHDSFHMYICVSHFNHYVHT